MAFGIAGQHVFQLGFGNRSGFGVLGGNGIFRRFFGKRAKLFNASVQQYRFLRRGHLLINFRIYAQFMQFGIKLAFVQAGEVRRLLHRLRLNAAYFRRRTGNAVHAVIMA